MALGELFKLFCCVDKDSRSKLLEAALQWREEKSCEGQHNNHNIAQEEEEEITPDGIVTDWRV
jgi:hypothetical protein